MVSCSGIVRGDPPATVPVIIFGGFCNWLELRAVLGFWDEDSTGFRGSSLSFSFSCLIVEV